MNEKALSELIMSKIGEWQRNQKEQTSGYEFEKSLCLMVNDIGADILQSSLGVIPNNRKSKKK